MKVCISCGASDGKHMRDCMQHIVIPTPLDVRGQIRAERFKIDDAHQNINLIAKQHIPEFHFLNHKVSLFWPCDESPIGMCVWDISKNGFNQSVQCYYCHGPTERK